jgi:hypothetical protein
MDRDGNDTPDNLIQFPRIGFAPPPAPPAPTAAGTTRTPEAEPAPAPAGNGAGGPLNLPARERRSPLDVVSELRDPGLSQPVIDTDFDMPPSQDGHIPDTFRPTPDTSTHRPAYGQQLGALSLAAALAVVVAALRGIHTLVQARRASREQHRAVDRVARSGGSSSSGGSSAGGLSGSGGRRGGRVQSGPEYGRTQLGRTSNSSGKSGNRPGKGPGGNSPGKGPGAGSDKSGPGRHRPRKDKTGPGRNSGKTHDRSGTGTGAGGGSHGKSKGPGVHRTSQGGSQRLLDRARRKQTDRNQGKNKPADSRADKKNPGGHGPDQKRPGKGAGGNPWTKDTTSKNRPAQKTKTHGKGGRTTLSDALYREAKRRMKRRRKSMAPPPLWSATKKTGPDKTRGPAGARKTTPGTKTGRTRYWGRAQARARDYWQRRRNNAPSDPGYTEWEFGDRTRRTPWEAAGMTGDYTVTVERIDDIGDAARPHNPSPAGALTPARAALGPAPDKNFPRPGTRRPRPMPYIPPAAGTKENRMPLPTHRGPAPAPRRIPGMDAQHETEVTLDDVCDLLEELTSDSFTTHDKCAQLAARAGALRERLLHVAHDLAVTNNVIGHATSVAMARLAEDMDVLVRQSEVMSTESLRAAETTEAADTAMNDAYRPITQATADAGLLAPSAPVHNQS